MNNCQLCDASFPSRNALFRHLEQDHAIPRELPPADTAQERTAASAAARLQYFNPHHDAYYRRQCAAGVLTVDDWEASLASFQTPLGIAFRLSSSSAVSGRGEYIRKLLQYGENKNSMFWKPSPYVPACRIATTPPREWPANVQQALMDAQDVGAVNRQEVCSMIPPLLLDVREGHTVLDLCAAPGSKSLQLLGHMNQLERAAAAAASANKSPGKKHHGMMLIANDANRQRLMTVARRSRTSRRTAFILNASDGRFFPTLRKWGGYKLKFDRVLADVPCSGDGTLRKLSKKEWDRWGVRHHLSVHKLQVRLLIRALQLVRKGGKVVYSTCSLDPIENEAVVSSALARLGGPSIYRILPAPEYLHPDAECPFVCSPGAKRWVVPHPDFGCDQPDVFESIHEVPSKLRKKDILPSMFPPGQKTKEKWEWTPTGDESSREEDLAKQEFYGDVMDASDAQVLEDMLPNCCRMLPHQLDSGGFFCAIIERVRPSYFAVCCPEQRGHEDPQSVHHGRIYFPVESTKTIRSIVAKEKSKGNVFYFEGLATLESAQKWLHKHNAYVVGRSEAASVLDEKSILTDSEKNNVGNAAKCTTWENRTPMFTPMFHPPHELLLAEFLDFYGLVVSTNDDNDETVSGVDSFPCDNVVVLGGGSAALEIASCRDPQVAHVPNDKLRPKYQNRKFFKLLLVSPEIRTLYVGGATFHPMELGLGLCWVPIPGSFQQPVDNNNNNNSRAEASGRYGLLDEAAHIVASCATKRVAALGRKETMTLLRNRELKTRSMMASNPNGQDVLRLPPQWTERWGRFLVDGKQVDSWDEGGVVVVCSCSDDSAASIFLSCLLTNCDTEEGRRMVLLTEQRLADGWLRLLQME